MPGLFRVVLFNNNPSMHGLDGKGVPMQLGGQGCQLGGGKGVKRHQRIQQLAPDLTNCKFMTSPVPNATSLTKDILSSFHLISSWG